MCKIKRVRYEKCPLIEVTYQLNFPTILSIEAEMPVKYQNAIRKNFPQYRTQTEQEGEITVNINGEEVNPIFRQRPIKKIHHFISEDGQWRITLAKNQLAISTLQYEQWEDMKEKFKTPLQAFADIYDQSYFDRIGLRYIDAIDREKLNLKDTEWRDLIKPHLLGCLGWQSEEPFKIKTSTLNTEIIMEDVSVKISSGLGMINKEDKLTDEAFILDCDYFKVGKVELSEIDSIVTKLHQKSTTFFRNSITKKLHEAMEPQEIEE